jgi:hypothetical protein
LLPCWSGEVISVAFAIDCHDREVLAYVAWIAPCGRTSGNRPSRRRTRFSGSVTTAPSNGLAEAFVKTFKRDYVDGAELRDAESVLHR